MSKRKNPKQKVVVPGKQAKSDFDGNSFYTEHPKWRFSKRDKLHNKRSIMPGEFDDILVNKLESFENMTWGEILTDKSGRNNNTKNHFMECDELTKEAQKRLHELNLFEKAQGTFCSLSLTGKIRLWGILIDGIFEIVRLDNEHEVYKVNKKHT